MHELMRRNEGVCECDLERTVSSYKRLQVVEWSMSTRLDSLFHLSTPPSSYIPFDPSPRRDSFTPHGCQSYEDQDGSLTKPYQIVRSVLVLTREH